MIKMQSFVQEGSAEKKKNNNKKIYIVVVVVVLVVVLVVECQTSAISFITHRGTDVW